MVAKVPFLHDRISLTLARRMINFCRSGKLEVLPSGQGHGPLVHIWRRIFALRLSHQVPLETAIFNLKKYISEFLPFCNLARRSNLGKTRG